MVKLRPGYRHGNRERHPAGVASGAGDDHRNRGWTEHDNQDRSRLSRGAAPGPRADRGDVGRPRRCSARRRQHDDAVGRSARRKREAARGSNHHLDLELLGRFGLSQRPDTGSRAGNRGGDGKQRRAIGQWHHHGECGAGRLVDPDQPAQRSRSWRQRSPDRHGPRREGWRARQPSDHLGIERSGRGDRSPEAW